MGLFQPRQSTVVIPGTQGYEEATGTAWADYDPQRANQLLDEMGLDKRNADGYRLRADGEVLSVTVVVSDLLPMWVSVTELALQQWEELGIKTSIKATTPTSNNTVRDKLHPQIVRTRSTIPRFIKGSDHTVLCQYGNQGSTPTCVLVGRDVRSTGAC